MKCPACLDGWIEVVEPEGRYHRPCLHVLIEKADTEATLRGGMSASRYWDWIAKELRKYDPPWKMDRCGRRLEKSA